MSCEHSHVYATFTEILKQYEGVDPLQRTACSKTVVKSAPNGAGGNYTENPCSADL